MTSVSTVLWKQHSCRSSWIQANPGDGPQMFDEICCFPKHRFQNKLAESPVCDNAKSCSASGAESPWPAALLPDPTIGSCSVLTMWSSKLSPCICQMFVHLSVCVSGTGVHCDHTVCVSAGLSLCLDSPMFWAPWHQSMSTYVQPSFSSSTSKRDGVWMCKLGVDGWMDKHWFSLHK